MKKHLFLSFLMADEGSFEKGVVFYDARSEGAVGYNVKPLPIENAIKQFKKASTEFSNNKEIVNEINRIKELLEFSSFFRKSDCMEDLYLIKASKVELEVLNILSDIK